jgi:NAD-dependent dihydropyrimidine dehydrogenase PreA subunit
MAFRGGDRLMTIKRIDDDLCTGCLRCVDVCPMDVLRETGDERVEIRYPQDCQCCYLCELACPNGAIEVLPWRAFEPEGLFGIFGGEELERGK